MSFNGLLNKTCDVQRFTKVQTSTGAIDKTFASVAMVACRIQKRGVSGDQDLATPFEKATHIIYFPIGTDILDRDRIENNGKIYKVVAVQADSSMHHLEVLVEQIVQ